jgi:ribonuclease Z
MPELLEEWPVEGDLVVPYEAMPPSLKKSMSDRWRQKVNNQKILEEQAK